MNAAGKTTSNFAPFSVSRGVLITGAAGSIGRKLSQILLKMNFGRIGLLDHFDHGLLATVESLRAEYPHAEIVDILCDVRNPARLTRSIAAFRPDLVVHAAALKHVDSNERHVAECVLTNLVGVRNALRASAAAGVHRFIQISTDKAAAPVSVMGAAKRLAELYLEDFRRAEPGMDLRAVRFGNVYGSQGSVVPRFLAQIERGGPVEVTHPDMERYFMTLDEACDAILRIALLSETTAAGVGAYVLDMGAPVRIADLARRLIAESAKDVDVAFTRPRSGEKLHEQLWDEFETARPCALTGAVHVMPAASVRPLSDAALDKLEAAALTLDGAPLAAQVFAALDRCLDRAEANAG